MGCLFRSVEEKAALASLGLRQAVREHLAGGHCDAASALLSQHAPELVHASGSDARPSLDVFFSVSCLKFIELVRCAPLRGWVLGLGARLPLACRSGRGLCFSPLLVQQEGLNMGRQWRACIEQHVHCCCFEATRFQAWVPPCFIPLWVLPSRL